jgi:hypothetical protein
MRRVITLASSLGSLVLTLGLASSAPAALMPFAGSITFEVAGNPPASIASLSGSLDALPDGSVVLPPGAFGTVATFPVADPFLSAIVVRASSLLSGTLGPNSVGFGGSVGLSGRLDLQIPPTLGLANLSVPLGIGSSFSSSTSTSNGLGAYAFFSVFFSPWTTATVSLIGTVQGSTTTLRTVSGSRTTVPGGGVVLSLVSPVQIFRQGGPGAQIRTFPGFARMNIRYGPEPSTLVLLAVGALALAAYGSRRARR